VLVSGATGGVGAFVVQLDYTADVPAAVAALRPDGIHAVVHLAGDGLELADLLVASGRIASTLGLTADHLEGRTVQVTPVMAAPRQPGPRTAGLRRGGGPAHRPRAANLRAGRRPRALADFAADTRGKLAISVV
jgi:hypothetical protein